MEYTSHFDTQEQIDFFLAIPYLCSAQMRLSVP